MFDNRKGRADAERQVNDDLAKSYDQLLVDIHEELLFNYIHEEQIRLGNTRPRTDEENTLHSAKRLASLQVKIAKTSENLQVRMKQQMWTSIGLSVVAIVIALIALWKQTGCL